MDENQIIILTRLLEDFRKCSKTLKESDVTVHHSEVLYGMKILEEIIAILKEMKNENFSLLGIRPPEKNSKGSGINVTNGVISLAQIGYCNDGFCVTLNKNSNSAQDYSAINFCMTDVQRQESIKEIINSLKIFDEITVTKEGKYRVYIQAKDEMQCSNLKKIVITIIDIINKANEVGTKHEYLKRINRLLECKME